MSWAAPTKSLAINNLSNLLKCKMQAYLAYGTETTANMPASLAAINALLIGAGQKFVPLGDLHKDPITFGWERTTIEMHGGTVREGLKISCEIKSAAMGAEAMALVDAAAMNDQVSFLLAPVNMPAAATVGAPVTVVFLLGMVVVDKGEGNGNNAFGTLTFSGTAEPDLISDVIKYVTVTS